MSTNLPSLSALRAFAAVARTGSFAAAAASLNVSTSAVSHQVQGLEALLTCSLLVRAKGSGGRTLPTTEGDVLLRAVDAAMATLGEACDTVRSRSRRARARLVVCASSTVVSLWLARRVAAFAARHPSVQWQVRTAEDTPDLVAEGLDMAVIRVPRGTKAKGDRLLFAETVFPVCTPAIAETVTVGSLARLNLIEEDHGTSRERSWQTWLEKLGAGQGRVGTVRFSTFAAAAAAALAGAGVALGRSPLLDDDIAAGRLVRPFGALSLPGSSDFVLRVRPDVARDPHVVQLRDYLAAS